MYEYNILKIQIYYSHIMLTKFELYAPPVTKPFCFTYSHPSWMFPPLQLQQLLQQLINCWADNGFLNS